MRLRIIKAVGLVLIAQLCATDSIGNINPQDIKSFSSYSSFKVKEITYFNDADKEFSNDKAINEIRNYSKKNLKKHTDHVQASFFIYSKGMLRYQGGGDIDNPIFIEINDGESNKLWHTEHKTVTISPANEYNMANYLSYIFKPYSIFHSHLLPTQGNQLLISPSVKELNIPDLSGISWSKSEEEIDLFDKKVICLVATRTGKEGKFVTYFSKDHDYCPVLTEFFDKDQIKRFRVEVLEVGVLKGPSATVVHFPQLFSVERYDEKTVLNRKTITNLMVYDINQPSPQDTFNFDYSIANRIIDTVNNVDVDLTR